MAATSSCKATTFFHLSLPKPTAPHKFSLSPKHSYLCSYGCSISSLAISQPQFSSPSARISKLHPPSFSSPDAAVFEEETEQSGTFPADVVPLDSGSRPPLAGCEACGRDEMERGCNGEGRIQGGIATVPGFGWWPIKAYRPCPAYVASGGRYRRTGQSMDEVVAGGGSRVAESSKREGPRRSR